MNFSEKKERTRLLKRQIKKSFGDKEITSPEVLRFIDLVNRSYIFNEEEDAFHRQAEKVSNKKYEELTKKLVEKNSFLNSFNHGMAHDVKNHSSNIIGLIQMLKKYTNKKDWRMIEEITKQLDSSSNQLTSIVQGFLHLSRIEFEENKKNSIILPGTLIKEIEYEIAYLKERKKVNIDYGIEDVFFNRQILKIIFVNLISNSIKYSKENKPANIKVRLYSNNYDVFLEVEDDGIGIDLESGQKKLFNLFNEVNGTKGYGVGLFLIRKIVDKNKGKIEVESKVDEGSLFKITMPKK